MRKKDIINMESIAYYSGFSGLEIKHIKYGIDDYIYCVSGGWGCGHILGLFYVINPRLCLYSTGLIYPNDCLIRFVLYHSI